MAAICGIDWADEWHDICIADSETGELLAEQRFSHDEDGIVALIDALREHAVERVTIERPNGLLVGRLLASDITLVAIHPNQVKAARDRFRPAGGKSDRFDAFVLCELARTDAHRFPALRPQGDETVALQALCRTREDLVATRVQLANQLRAQLEVFWPGAARIFADVDSKIALAFIERYPTAGEARGLGIKRLERFLARHGYCGRRSPEALIERLRSAPVASVGDAEQEARRQAVLALVSCLRPVVARVAELTSEIKGAVHSHPDGAIFLAFFRDPKSVVTAAGLLCEIGDNRARYPNAAALAAAGGQAPVAVESGKQRAAAFRWACDKRLRGHLCVLADSTRHWHPWAGDVYARARARGQDHPHAIRTLGRAWCRVLWRCWQDGVPYDPARHGNLNRLVAVEG
jgi:transposase